MPLKKHLFNIICLMYLFLLSWCDEWGRVTSIFRCVARLEVMFQSVTIDLDFPLIRMIYLDGTMREHL